MSAAAPALDRRPGGALRTKACELFGIDYPIVQTGMGWVAGPALAATTSAAGGLGILAAATLTYDQLESAIAEIKRRTDKPFGVNFRSDQHDVEKRVALLIRERVRVASFGQAPKQDLIKRLKDGGVLTMPTVGARRHAEKVASWGVDALIAQGQEGGGHTGAVPTSLLLPQVVDCVDIPVLGAGGFFDGRGLVAALAFGAAGIAMGTRFLLTRESSASERVKQIYVETDVAGTVVTRKIDGHPQRVIRTELVDSLENANAWSGFWRALRHAWAFRKLTGTTFRALLKEGLAMKRAQHLSWAQMTMAASAPMLTRASMVDGRPEVGILPTGQNVGLIEDLPSAADLVARIMREAEGALARLA